MNELNLHFYLSRMKSTVEQGRILENLSKIDRLAHVLDREYFKGISKIFSFSMNHISYNEHGESTQELSTFLILFKNQEV